MNKLLFILLLMTTSISTTMGQVGTDPYLVDANGSPVMVPSRSSRSADFGGSQNEDRFKYEIPGTLRGAERNLLGENLPPKEPIEYASSIQLRDTTSVYVIDQEGKPVREMDQLYFNEAQSEDRNEIEIFPSEYQSGDDENEQ